jgi:phosphoenolpyruvate carboxylase
MYRPPKIERFRRDVLSKYNVYNSIFLTLPFDAIDNTGSLLPLFGKVCQEGFANKLSPKHIVELFSEKYLGNPDERELIDMMFRFIQYIERQIVLFDAVEDAAFPIVNNLEGKGSLREVKENAEDDERRSKLQSFLKYYKVRPVLTAHPTQFYPGPVLGIITDLTLAIRRNDLNEIQQLLSQLGKTPFIKKVKPTPFDEAVSLVWYLENVFYDTAGEMATFIQKNIFQGEQMDNPVLQLGFWPGGDRDGNPFVTAETTLNVANRLRTSILKCYYSDIRLLKRKLTFPGVDNLLAALEDKIYRSAFYSKGEVFISLAELKSGMQKIRALVVESHQSLYLDEIDNFINKVNLFGFHFASLDIRQNSKIHDAVVKCIAQIPSVLPPNYFELSEAEKMKALAGVKPINVEEIADELTKGTLESVLAMKKIQQSNGELGSNRYVISNNESALNVMETLSFFRMCGWENPTVDIVPLFEVIDDLQGAASIMERLYTDRIYSEHLKNRKSTQTVMLGFSDGTKDGGYLMANWSIYKAKEAISAVSEKYGIDVIFFDGRGGPPARGGGKTHKFYASLGPGIVNREIQITIQGQTISSNFGTNDSARYNLENLLSAGISNHFNKEKHELSNEERNLMDSLADAAYSKYVDFKNHPKFIPYLEKMSTLKYYSKANIGSRPTKRGQADQLDFADLRAIPFVASWSQLKQNVPGFFGVGTALKSFEKSGKWEEVAGFYDRSLFFRTLLENSMMSLAKSFFPLTSYMREDAEFGEFWQIIFDEFTETKRLLLKIAGHEELMENYPDGKASIEMREHIVQPLLVLQQFALSRIDHLRKHGDPDNLVPVYEKIVTRSLFGNTNASRNSA